MTEQRAEGRVRNDPGWPDSKETDSNQRLRDAAREYAEAWCEYKDVKRKAAAVRELEEAARSFAGFDPSTDYEGEDTRALDGAGVWRCANGHEVRTSVAMRVSGCITCGELLRYGVALSPGEPKP